jgi:hypothetical protein
MYWVRPAKQWAPERVHLVGDASRQVYSPLGGKDQDSCPSCLHPLLAAPLGYVDGKEENQCWHSAVWRG